MSSDSKIWKLGIIGWPLGYSLSPLMHNAALRAAGLKGDKYREFPIQPKPAGDYGPVADWLNERLRLQDMDGVNVTMPYKPHVAAWCRSTQGAQIDDLFTKIMDAVNTVVFRGPTALGYNTDGGGFLEPLVERRFDPEGRRVVLLGAGGAASAIAVALALLDAEIFILNRHCERAELLSRRMTAAFETIGNRTSEEAIHVVKDVDSLPLDNCDLLVNATPMGMAGEEEVSSKVLNRLHKGQTVYDIVYEPRETRLIREARKRGCTVITGDEMLAAQGAAAFEIWTGVPAAKVLPAMKKALDEHFAGRG